MLNGRLLNDRYQVQEMIGGGGMANVYLAFDTILERDVAIKVLRLEHGNDDEFIARFHREAQSATSLSHPNIVDIFDVGEEDDIYYMVMEYVDGMTLKQYIQSQSPIEIKKAINIIKQVTAAIAHAHENGIVHRDIKPQNILIDHYGHVKVTDFGIAMALSATALTQTNSVLGSVHYMSPEQARGGMATEKSDIYAVGIVFFELLTGRLPFSGESPVSIALKHLQHHTPSLRRWISDLPQSVENIVLKATAKDPFHRYHSLFEMENDLETCLQLDRMNEPAFVVPEEDGEEKTKAIPVITKESYGNHAEESTIIHGQTNPHTIVNESAQGKAEEPDPKKKKKKVWPWMLSSLLLLLALGAAALFVPGFIQPKEVEVPDVSGMEYGEAFNKLRELNLNIERETQYSDTLEEGLVIKTDPEAGTTIDEETTVTVFSSLGKERVLFEDYTGKDFERVKSDLEEKGYEEVIAFDSTSEEPPGVIIAQVSPQEGEEVIPEETRVIFRVSSGPPMVTLNPLEGLTRDQAIAYLEREGLQVNIEESYSQSQPQGEVISQDPGAGSEVAVGSDVTITISLGPEPAPEDETVELPGENNENPEEEKPEDNPEPEQKPREEVVEVTVPFNTESEKEKQQVLIYIDDKDHDINEVYLKEEITEDTTYEIPLMIEPNEEATYKVQLEDEVVINESVSY